MSNISLDPKAITAFFINPFVTIGTIFASGQLSSILFPPELANATPAGGLSVQTSQYGIPIRYAAGRVKVPGNLLWYGNFQAHEVEQKSGGKAGEQSQVVGYEYTVSLAWGLCLVPAGKTATLLRAWSGSTEISTAGIAFYSGAQTSPDSHMAAFVPRAPVWKRLCYAVIPDLALGSSVFVKNLTFEIQIGPDADVSPTVVTDDILTDDLFGLGLESSLIDSTAAAETAAYCLANDLKIALTIDQQMSVLDCLSYVIGHHDGYISYAGGVIAHKQLKFETSPATIDDSFMVRAPGEPSAVASYQGDRDYKNRITVEYSKRAADYVNGTAPVDDGVDIDRYGLRDATLKLPGLTTYARAEKAALLALRKSLTTPHTLEFTVGPELAGLHPGDVFAITLPDMGIDADDYRVATLTENENYETVVTMRREYDVYDGQATGSDSSSPSLPPDLTAAAGNVVRPLLLEVPALYSEGLALLAITYSQSGSASWAGAAINRSYASGGAYSKLQSKVGSGVTGEVIAVGPGTIDVELDWAATLSSAVSFDELVLTRLLNLAVFRAAGGDRFVRYQTVDLIGANQWRLSALLYDDNNLPLPGQTGDIAAGDDVMFYSNVPHALAIPAPDANRTVYYKMQSFNLANQLESLSGCTEVPITFKNLLNKPLPPVNLSVNGLGIDSNGSCFLDTSEDAVIVWMTRNRAGTGMTNYTRSDTIVDDADKQGWRVDIYSGATLKRSATVTAKTYTYTAADRATDGNPSPVTLKIYQVGTLETSEPAQAVITYA